MKLYQPLKAGDVRQLGDEQATKRFNKSNGGYMAKGAKTELDRFRSVDLVGHPILAADLIHLEFRRPV